MNSIQKTFTVSSIQGNDTFVAKTESEATNYILSKGTDAGSYMIMPSYKVVPSEQITFRASIVMPIYGNPVMTLRAIKSVLNQDTNGWQLLCLGDGCNDFAKLLAGEWFQEQQAKAYLNGNEIIGLNTDHRGGYGFYQREIAKQLARGKWTLYLDNDDIITSNHVSSRLQATISEGELDMLFFNSWIAPTNHYRDAQLLFGKIGNAEIMFRTEFLKTLPPLSDRYGHDWEQISQAIGQGARHKKGEGISYIVKSLKNPNEKEKQIYFVD